MQRNQSQSQLQIQSQVQVPSQSQSQSQSPSQVNSQPSQIQIEIPINFNRTMEQIRNNTKITQDSFDLVEVSKKIEKALIESWHDEEYSHLQAFQYDGPRFSKRKHVYDN